MDFRTMAILSLFLPLFLPWIHGKGTGELEARSGGCFSTNQSHARLAQSVERETLTSTRSQGCGFDPRIGLFL
ncbi:uncharacterized protein B0J16DRAFT_340447 [Fusarium flagelliforme]|uniref:uncharacterized protein n=1 Tax=Fusarium flagelliforme TaxID=2675880 RepID=UPI001E8EE1A7|nr:uncharacterized protein B0J16DRAFT_340447 [Fusarium flagelliforme]KAH7184772.1 hypothetical protein B0J16DRAFT_340447 [Fusarium flagelliforme]